MKERINIYQNVFYKINTLYKISVPSLYDCEWFFDYDNTYPKDLLSDKALYPIVEDEFDRCGGVYYRMCRR